MPWKVKTFMLIDVPKENEVIYADKTEAEGDAEQVMFLQPGEILASVVECDENGQEVS